MSRRAAVQCLDQIQYHWGDARAGQWNCRKISGSSTWSQHAWGAALDLYHVDYGYSTDPAHQEYLDGIYEWLDTYREELSIRTMLWRTTDHWNHIHVDFWAKGYGDPPCADGTHRTQTSDGTVHPGDFGPENGYLDGYLPGPETHMYIPKWQWDYMVDALFEARPDLFKGNPDYFKDPMPEGIYDDPTNVDWDDGNGNGFWPSYVKAISNQT